jgi:hypothetical protein
MRHAEVNVNALYLATVSGRKVPVRVLQPMGKGFRVLNLATDRTIRTATAGRLLKPLTEQQAQLYLTFVRPLDR